MNREETTGGFQDGGPPGSKPKPRRSIFRSEAMEHYLQNQEKVVLPRLMSPRLFRILWLVALLLVTLGMLIAFWPLI